MPEEQRKSLSGLSKKIGEVMSQKQHFESKVTLMENERNELLQKITELESTKESNTEKIQQQKKQIETMKT